MFNLFYFRFILCINMEYFDFSCWLSVETGAIWAFVGPGLTIILVSVTFSSYIIFHFQCDR